MPNPEEKFGEQRPQRRDADGNNFFQLELHPMKFEVCECRKQSDGHITLSGSIEQDMPSVSNPMELMQLMMTGQPIPTEKKWVPIMRVLSSYN